MAILAINAGSSSLKFSLHPVLNGQVLPEILAGSVQGLQPGGTPEFGWKYREEKFNGTLVVPEGSTAFKASLDELRALVPKLEGLPEIQAIAHRVVHGGGIYISSVLIDDAVLERLAQFNSLAPLHQPHNIEGIRRFREAFPLVPQVACFDTAFHAHMPERNRAFALPRSLTEQQGIRRYGFHGLSYQYIQSVLQERSARANQRVVMAHLGSGASLCATLNGTSIATTMGFSALDGLMMGSRCGDVDPGVLLYLMEQGWDHARIQNLLYKESGLLGVSGISADMRTLRADSSEHAKQAIDQFTHSVVRETGALVATLEGLDVLAFSGGIGENDPSLRAQACQRLAWLGIRIDEERNRNAGGKHPSAIHAADSAVEVWVIPTDEGRVAARDAAALLRIT